MTPGNPRSVHWLPYELLLAPTRRPEHQFSQVCLQYAPFLISFSSAYGTFEQDRILIYSFLNICKPKVEWIWILQLLDCAVLVSKSTIAIIIIYDTEKVIIIKLLFWIYLSFWNSFFRGRQNCRNKWLKEIWLTSAIYPRSVVTAAALVLILVNLLVVWSNSEIR